MNQSDARRRKRPRRQLRPVPGLDELQRKFWPEGAPKFLRPVLKITTIARISGTERHLLFLCGRELKLFQVWHHGKRQNLAPTYEVRKFLRTNGLGDIPPDAK